MLTIKVQHVLLCGCRNTEKEEEVLLSGGYTALEIVMPPHHPHSISGDGHLLNQLV